MSRRKKTFKREIIPDPVFKDLVIAKFVNKMMIQGKKATAQKLFYGALKELEGKVQGEDSLTVFKKALETVKPSIEVRSRRVGGATYQVPMEVRPSRRTALAMRWLVDAAAKRSEKTMALRLAGELLDAAEGKGAAIKKREDVHRMAEANKAFSHYRF